VDIVVEVNVIANADLDVKVTGTNATIASYADAPVADSVTIPVRPSMAKNLRWQFLLTYTVASETKEAAVRAVSAAAAAGVLRVGAEYGLPLTRFPLEETAAAHDAVEQGVVGKVLIDVA
jgi:NADPH2:quinone reductase